MEPIGGIGFFVGVGADDKIAVKLIKCGCWKVRFADQDYYSSQEKDTKEKEISTSNILPECYSL
jgi:endothelin-converting enzyme/putative endopeptidase